MSAHTYPGLSDYNGFFVDQSAKSYLAVLF